VQVIARARQRPPAPDIFFIAVISGNLGDEIDKEAL